MTNNPTDLQAALRKACEDAAVGCIDLLDDTAYANEYQISKFAEIIERRLTPVVEALRISVIEECASVEFDARSIEDQNPYYEDAWHQAVLFADAWACGWYTAIRKMRAAIRALKGAPR